MRKLLAMVLALALTVLLFGCTSEQPAETDPEVTLSSEEIGSSLSTDSGTQVSDLPAQTDSAPSETDSASDPVSTEENVDLPVDFSQIDLSVDVIYNENTLTFYHIRRDVFLEFLDKPSTAILTASEGEPVALGDRYSRGSALFFTDFGCVPQLSTPERASAYLKTRNIEKNVKHVFWFDVPGEPIFAWIVGEDCNYIVSFKFDYEIEEKVAVLHTFEDFRQLHRAVFATITVDGQPIQGGEKAILYHNYADIPLLATLKSIGAVVTEQNGDIYKLNFQNVNYTLNLDAPSMVRDDVGSDFLNECSGFVFVYRAGRELFVDTSTLGCVGNGMNISIHTELDRNRKVVDLVFTSQTSPSEKNCKLIVKGKDITSEAFVHLHEESGYIDLPITAIMEELGATVVWTDGIVTIFLEDKTTTYDTTIPYFGMPLPPGGTYMARKVIAGDLVLDNIAVRSLLKAWTGMNIYVDMENKIVEIK